MNQPTYIEQIARDIAMCCDDHDPDESDMPLYRIYAVLALAKGDATTARDVHDAWSAWQMGIMPEHWSIVPFDQLAERVQQMDQQYVDAIHAVAAKDGRA